MKLFREPGIEDIPDGIRPTGERFGGAPVGVQPLRQGVREADHNLAAVAE